MLKKLAVTGSVAAGKSTVCQLFEQLGAYCISADAIVARCLQTHHPIARRLVQIVGSDVVSAGSNELNKRLIAQRIFKNQHLLKRVESVLHPVVYQQIQQDFDTVSPNVRVFVAEVPLLFEVGWQAWFDAILLVAADKPKRLERFLKRPGATREDFEARDDRLMSEEKKRELAHFILDTSSASIKSIILYLQTIIAQV